VRCFFKNISKILKLKKTITDHKPLNGNAEEYLCHFRMQSAINSWVCISWFFQRRVSSIIVCL